ncbi:MAG TPA: DUF6152 family protein [Bryobacteraceae bacterium]|nr:DUF6152 family protein [Bryobacteraceae bacterium]
MKRQFSVFAAAALLVGGLPAWAHHSFAAEFDGSRSIRVIGTITRIEWSNPHSYFYVDVKDERGNVVNWGCEGAGPGALTRRGWKKGDVKLGDTLIVDGYPAKDGSHLMDARRVTLPDGRSVSGGSAGDGGPGDADSLTAQDPAKTKK